MDHPATTALLAASALHTGFQLTVTLLVYPALADVPPASWARAHEAHSRRITPLVGLVYLSLAGTGLAAVLSEPGSAWVWGADAAALTAGLLTAAGAAPTHGRLGRAHSAHDVRRLLAVDRLRTLAAVLGLGCALAAVLT